MSASPDIFLSYNREDAEVARRFAEGFEAQGFDVWWDQTLRAGEAYDKVTEAALRGAKAVVVLWSQRSVDSRWVRAEATIADRNGTLMPVMIEPCERPVMFELTQAAELAHWRGAKGDKAWLAFLDHVRRMVENGAERTVEAPSDGPLERAGFWRSSRNRVAAATSAVLLIVGAGTAYVVSWPAERVATSSLDAVKASTISLAVLPFVNLSSDKDQEFFSDGMTEEITSALAKVQSWHVVGRTSAFQFKGTNKDLRSIGHALGATHLIEGSVRKEGNEVRITAQLIRADDGTHLWSESYNRELKEVFAVQEDIATAIAGALRTPLGLKTGQLLVASRTSDTDSYQDYLRARALVRTRGNWADSIEVLTQAARLLEQVVARDPEYAPAWGLLAQTSVYMITPVVSRDSSVGEIRPIVADLMQKGDAAAQQAIRLDPNNADGYAAWGLLQRYRGRVVEAEELGKRALSLDPGNPEAIQQYSNTIATVGRLKEALPLRRDLEALEPLVPIFRGSAGAILWANGRNDEAVANYKATLSTPMGFFGLVNFYAAMGRYKEAVDLLRTIPSGRLRPELIEEAIRLLRTAPTPTQAASHPTRLSRTSLGFVYLYVGAPERALDNFDRISEAGVSNSIPIVWTPAYAPARKTEKFKALVRKMGLVDYWQVRGWPEYCKPTTDDDFECH